VSGGRLAHDAADGQKRTTPGADCAGHGTASTTAQPPDLRQVAARQPI
jgi:hypothetical protein